ncbi:MAG: PDC sensor domain-containing protein [Gammaproteobacteria bacterium]|nr:PDC sensor domain-containing protein [Gammaproteobacteria bacterium]
MSDLYRSAATGTFCFTVSAALRRASGEVVGVLGADVSFERLVR